MIDWKDPKKELPKDGEIVAALMQHWKKDNPRSFEIHFGEVEIDNKGKGHRINTMDFTGMGSFTCDLVETEYNGGSDVAVAWAYAYSFNFPEWCKYK